MTDFSRASFKTALLIQQVLVTAYLIYVYSSALRIRHRLAMKTSAECHTSFEGTLGNRPRNGLTLGLFRWSASAQRPYQTTESPESLGQRNNCTHFRGTRCATRAIETCDFHSQVRILANCTTAICWKSWRRTLQQTSGRHFGCFLYDSIDGTQTCCQLQCPTSTLYKSRCTWKLTPV